MSNFFVTIKDAPYNAAGDGVTNDDAIRAIAEFNEVSVYWPKGTYILNQAPSLTVSWGPGVCLVNGQRVYLRPTPDTAKTILAEVFGLPADGQPADAPIQAAITFAQSLRLMVELPPNRDWTLATGLFFAHGRNATETFQYDPQMEGNGTILRVLPGV
jgi:hypothetical protein